MVDVMTKSPEQVLAEAGWRTDMDAAPRDRRLPVRTEMEVYIAHWAKNPFTNDEAWIVANFGDDGDQLLVKPIMWHAPLPDPDQPDPVAAALRASFDREKALREAVMAVVEASRAYLPPDGISADEFINRVLYATDNPRINPFILEA